MRFYNIPNFVVKQDVETLAVAIVNQLIRRMNNEPSEVFTLFRPWLGETTEETV